MTPYSKWHLHYQFQIQSMNDFHAHHSSNRRTLEHRSRLWNSIRNLPVQSKIKMFLWQATLSVSPPPIGRNLMWRGMIDTTAYAQCGFQYEDDIPALFECVFTKEVCDQLLLGNKWRKTLAVISKDLIHIFVTL